VSSSGSWNSDDGKLYFSGVKDRVQILAEEAVNLDLTVSRAGTLVIKEIYNGGTSKAPAEGTLQNDQYVIIYNNYHLPISLEGWSFGKIEPGNSTTNNTWWLTPNADGTNAFPSYVPVGDCVWEFPKASDSGEEFVVEPYGQVVLVTNGAVDHSAEFPLSVNLNKSDYFITYDNQLFTHEMYHPTPGNQIRTDHYLDALRKLGQSTGYGMSVSCPGILLFKVADNAGTTLAQYVSDDANTPLLPSSSTNRMLKVPYDWVRDAVEVFREGATNNAKRFAPEADGGFVYLSQSYLGHTLYRNVDKEATLAIEGNEAKLVYNYSLGNDPSGIDAEASIKNGCKIVYKDTNNSTNDFHERSVQSLHKSAPINQ
jgi:hypothetical protein